MLEIGLVQALIEALLAILSGNPGIVNGISPGVTSFVTTLTAQLPVLVGAGVDVKSFLDTQLALVQTMISENRDPTQAEWDALDVAKDAELAKLRNQATPPTA